MVCSFSAVMVSGRSIFHWLAPAVADVPKPPELLRSLLVPDVLERSAVDELVPAPEVLERSAVELLPMPLVLPPLLEVP